MESGFPNFNFNVSHHGDYVAIASEPMCLVGLDIVSHFVPVNETTDKFIQSFLSYFSDLEWRNICNAGSSNEMLRVFYRYIYLSLDHFRCHDRLLMYYANCSVQILVPEGSIREGHWQRCRSQTG